MSSSTVGQRRTFSFFVLVSALLLGYVVLGTVVWTGNETIHSVLEVLATFLALMVGTLALVRYYSRPSTLFLFVGVGFLGAGLLDAYHAVITAEFFGEYYLEDQSKLVPWSWIVSRIFLALSLFLAWVTWFAETLFRRTNLVTAGSLYTAGGVILVLTILILWYVPLPRAYYPELFFARPEEIVPGVLFLWALVGFIYSRIWVRNTFEYWLVVSLIIAVPLHVLFMATSTQPFDTEFDVAHLLKILSYIAVLIGLIANMYELFRAERVGSQKLLEQAEKLVEEKRRVERAQHTLKRNEERLEEALKQSNASKSALVNLLDDLEEERQVLKETAARLELATRAGKLGVWEYDPATGLFEGDETTRAYFGINKNASVSLTEVFACVADEKQEEAMTLFTAIGDGTVPSVDFVVPVHTKQGGRKFIQVFGLVQESQEGSDTVVGVAQDVTEDQLIDKAKTEFVSLASHQLRTPLSTINWYSEMLLAGDAGKLSKKQLQYLREVDGANQRMISLVNSLLNVSRIELGTFSVEPRPMSFIDTVETVLHELEQTIAEKKITLTKNLEEVPEIVADEELLRMVATNLISNAVKYTPEGGDVTVETSVVRKGGVVNGHKAPERSILFSVADTGYGIPKEQQEHIFEKLFRADNVKRMDTEGTGLGLYIVKSIVTITGGEVWFESKENVGTTFYALIPLAGMEAREGSRRLD